MRQLVRNEVLPVLRIGAVLSAIEEDVVAVGEGFRGDAGAHFRRRVVGMKAHIREVPPEAGFHLGLQVAGDAAALALERGDLTGELGGQGDAAAGVAGADGAGDLSFCDDGIGHCIGFPLGGIAGSGHFELGFDQDLGGFGHGGIGLVGLLRLPLVGRAVLEMGVHSGVVLGWDGPPLADLYPNNGKKRQKSNGIGAESSHCFPIFGDKTTITETMATIKVWVGADGKWSEGISGLDKMHIIKHAILLECRSRFNEHDEDWDAMLGVEIDANEIYVTKKEYNRDYIGGDNLVERACWSNIEQRNHIQLESARLLKLPYNTFVKMVNAEKKTGYLYPVYLNIFKALKVEEDDVQAKKGYCLLLKIEDEEF